MTNTSRVAIAPYKRGSKSARLLKKGLSEALGRDVLFINPERVGLCKPSRVVINWGSSGVSDTRATVINPASAVLSLIHI